MDAKERGDTGEPDAPPSAEESAAAEELREALASRAPNDAADFARALSLAHEPRTIDADEHRGIVERAIANGEERRDGARKRGARAGVRTIGIAGVIALAAGIALAVMRPPFDGEGSSVASVEPLLPARSTQPLFREPFAQSGGESARIDRIASARAADLRDNRFAAWGVR
jgi:hypothetical protein